MKIIEIAVLGFTAASLCACDTPRQSLSENMGNAVTHNMAMHIINPQGSRVEELPGTDGEPAAFGKQGEYSRLAPHSNPTRHR